MVRRVKNTKIQMFRRSFDKYTFSPKRVVEQRGRYLYSCISSILLQQGERDLGPAEGW